MYILSEVPIWQKSFQVNGTKTFARNLLMCNRRCYILLKGPKKGFLNLLIHLRSEWFVSPGESLLDLSSPSPWRFSLSLHHLLFLLLALIFTLEPKHLESLPLAAFELRSEGAFRLKRNIVQVLQLVCCSNCKQPCVFSFFESQT